MAIKWTTGTPEGGGMENTREHTHMTAYTLVHGPRFIRGQTHTGHLPASHNVIYIYKKYKLTLWGGIHRWGEVSWGCVGLHITQVIMKTQWNS